MDIIKNISETNFNFLQFLFMNINSKTAAQQQQLNI